VSYEAIRCKQRRDSAVWEGGNLVAVGGRAKQRMDGRDLSARVWTMRLIVWWN